MDIAHSETLNLGEMLKNDNFSHLFVRMSVDKESGLLKEFLFKLVDGVEIPYTSGLDILFENHVINICTIKDFIEVMSGKIHINDICLRANSCNKIILKYLGIDKNLKKKFLTRCTICGHESIVYLFRLENCRGCQINNSSKTQEVFIEECKQLNGDRFDYSLVRYKSSRLKVDIKCNKCGVVFSQAPKWHLRGQGCPNCKESRGELYLKKILRENNIEFIPQHTFPGLKYINPLKCDVYVPIVNLIIEIDGEGHRKPIFGSTPEEKQKRLENQQKCDAIKDNYAKVNGINLLRIPVDSKDKDLSFIGEIAMNCYNNLLKVKNPVQLTLDI
jgi:hypothetical protein